MGLSIQVKHNVEMGHRLSLQPDSKCYHLHGHSWWITLTMQGPVRNDGMIIDFGIVKQAFRGFLDKNFDHHFLLNSDDILVTLLDSTMAKQFPNIFEQWGIVTMPDHKDPTVENFADLILQWCRYEWPEMDAITVHVQESSVNAAIAEWVLSEAD